MAIHRTERISFSLTKGAKREIEDFCKKKKRWKSPSDMVRDATYQLMSRYPIYRKNGEGGDR